MDKKNSEPGFADEDQIRTALDALDESDLLRLNRIAQTIGSLTLGRDPRDLLQEAILRTLSGQRKWNMGTNFLQFLAGTMKSIAWSWRKQKREQSEAARLPPQTQEDILLRDAESDMPNPERISSAKEKLQRITARFKHDEIASQVIEAWAMGCTGPEIQELGAMTFEEFAAAVKRIRRYVKSEAKRV